MCDFERYNIKVVEGNEFTLLLPLKSRTFVASRQVDEDIVIEDLENLRVFVNNTEYSSVRKESDGVAIDFPATLKQGDYDVVLTANYHGVDIRAAYNDAVIIVAWNQQSDAQQYVQGSPFVLPAAYVLGVMTDSELEALKAQLRLEIVAAQRAKEEAEQAKEEYITKAEALDNVAQQSTLTQGVQYIREDISHIDIDTSNLAKQGTNPNATLTEVQEKIGTPANGQAATLFGAIGDVAFSAQTIQSLADSWAAEVTNRKSLSGIVCSREVSCVADILANPSIVLEINDIRATTLQQGNAFSKYTNLRKLELGLVNVSNNNSFLGIHDDCEIRLPYATTIDGNALTSEGAGRNNYRILYAPNVQSVGFNIAYNNSYAQEIYLDSITSIPDYAFRYSDNLRILYIPKVSSISMIENLEGYSSLIDFTIGENMRNNFSLVNWSPTYALDSSSQSLLTPEDIAAGFTSNLQKLLYNIREHIAANLPVAPNTIIFSEAVKAAIQADQATADAFTNKGWTIA